MKHIALACLILSDFWAQATPAQNELSPREKEEGYRLLFNGTDLSNFRADPKRGHHHWEVRDGALTLIPADPKIHSAYSHFPLFTTEEFENYALKADFRTEPNPESGHSGIVLRYAKPKSHEPSSLDVSIFGPARKQGYFATGAFSHGVQAPSRMAVKPAGEWNSFLITVQGRVVRVELNGQEVNALDLDQWDRPRKRPDGSEHQVPLALKDLPSRSPIGFRDDYGIGISFRNLKIKPLPSGAPPAPAARAPEAPSSAAGDNVLTEEERKAGWLLLFNGKDLNGWRASGSAYAGYGKWIVEDGTIGLCLYGGFAKYVSSIHLMNEREFERYILQLDFKTSSNPGGAHSGVILRTGDPKRVEQTTLEVAIYGAGARPGHYCTGAFRHDLQAPSRNACKPAGEWNRMAITVDQEAVTVEINGEKVNRIVFNEWATPGKRPDGTDHKLAAPAIKDMPSKGAIGFRDDHGTPLWLKNIKLKPLE